MRARLKSALCGRRREIKRNKSAAGYPISSSAVGENEPPAVSHSRRRPDFVTRERARGRWLHFSALLCCESAQEVCR
jgi:hypothetical protein